MIRWLSEGRGDFHEQPVKIYPNHELLVTKTGRVEDEPGSRKLYQLILDSYYAKRKPGTTAELATELRRLQDPLRRVCPYGEGAGGIGRPGIPEPAYSF